MLTIRLTRVGKKKDTSFRIIIIDSKRKVKAGNYLELLGTYDPRINKAELKADRIKHWLSMGAKTSDTLHNLLISQKVIEGKKINVLPRKSPPKKEEVPVVEDKIKTHTPEVVTETPSVQGDDINPRQGDDASGVSSEVVEDATTDKIER